jgi:hypothetical protein
MTRIKIRAPRLFSNAGARCGTICQFGDGSHAHGWRRPHVRRCNEATRCPRSTCWRRAPYWLLSRHCIPERAA